jgi:hypothetical protein
MDGPAMGLPPEEHYRVQIWPEKEMGVPTPLVTTVGAEDLDEHLPALWVQEAYTSLQAPNLAPLATGILVQQQIDEQEEISWLERIEDALILLVSAALMIIALMIGLALSSAGMNELFSHMFHVDFRAEIAYLFQLIPY